MHRDTCVELRCLRGCRPPPLDKLATVRGSRPYLHTNQCSAPPRRLGLAYSAAPPRSHCDLNRKNSDPCTAREYKPHRPRRIQCRCCRARLDPYTGPDHTLLLLHRLRWGRQGHSSSGQPPGKYCSRHRSNKPTTTATRLHLVEECRQQRYDEQVARTASLGLDGDERVQVQDPNR